MQKKETFIQILASVWCLAKIVVPIPKKVKLSLIAVDYIFSSYAYNISVYRFLMCESNILDIHKYMIIESTNT